MPRCYAERDRDGNVMGYFVECPGCQSEDGTSGHFFAVRMSDGRRGWEFNGDFERPTFRPSMLAQSVWGPERKPCRCHSFVTDGKIQYLDDCTHSLKGQTVALPEVK